MRTFRQLLLMLTLTLCGTVLASAYEYFTICFHDGTRSGVFYTNSIDSIRYSTIDLDSTLYSEWKVQEIWTPDSVYRYRLADIDSLSFTNVNVDLVAENIAHISSYINPLFLQSKSSYELLQRINEINNFDYVENVSIDEQSLFVTIKDWGDLTYSYPPKPTADIEPITVNHAPHFIPNKHRKSIAGYPITVHKQKEVKNVCVVKQMSKDEDPDWKKSFEQIELTDSLCGEWGFNVTPLDSLSVDFFAKDIKKYDLVFLFTHGTYNGLHWFATSEEIYCQPINKKVDEDSLNRVAKDFILNKYYKNGYANNEIGFDILPETRDSVPTIVCNTWISEKFIARHRNPSSKNIILFNYACMSMKDGPSAAIAFNNSGVDCYTGFNEINRIAPWTYTSIILRMLSGMSLYSSIDKLPEHLKTETFVPEGWKEEVTTTLQLYPNNQSKSAICLTHPTTLASKMVTSNGNDAIELAGKIQILDGSLIVEAGGHFGFLLSDNPNPEPSNSIDINDITYDDTDYETTSTLRYNANINIAELPSNARYYRAYLFDGKSLCLGEVKELELKQEAYVVLNGGTLTFYYDDKKTERDGTVYDIKQEYTSYNDRPQWSNASATKAIFDKSFADYRPISTAYWFLSCSKLLAIEGLQNLNTSNVTDMGDMFDDCSSLTSLDLSNFNTANVTYMGHMFYKCTSLTSLDLSGFNTAKVTNMGYMFSGCSSLTRLDLRSFNTSNVKYMNDMFYGCSSLTSLDLSSFNTAKVT
ncbi:MAG: BspA family leucine-rich repeat surface protein, partial [Muribaculaceae bacterium]|nr:BspA family leucine-rich repeat surface protein [Muribaculaceae bacterium]